MGTRIPELILAAILFAPAPQQSLNGVVAGQIRSDTGPPARVRVVAVDAQDPAAVAAGTAAIVSLTQTDDAGRYRLENVPPGRYYIMAGFLDSPTYYPGAVSVSDATVIAVRGNLTIEAMDFILKRSAGINIAGNVVRDPRAVVYFDQLRVLLSTPQNAFFMETPIAADGSFEFARVPSGKYTARVYPGSLDYSTAPIEVKDKDIEDLRLSVPFTVNVKAHLLVDGLIPRITMSFTNAAGSTLTPSPIADLLRTPATTGESVTIALPEGEYRVAISQIPAGYELKSIVQGRIDLLKEPLKISAGSSADLTITMALKSPAPWVKVSGRVTGAVPSDSVRAILRGPAVFRNLDVPVRPDGTFEFPQVLPGSYFIQLNPNLAGTMPLALTVGKTDVNDVVFAVPRTRQVSGRLTADNGSPAPQLQLVFSSPGNNSFEPLRFRPTIQADGTFKLTLPEGVYDLHIEGLPPGYRIKSLLYGSMDVLKDQRIKIAAEDSSDLLVTSDFTSPSPWVKISGRVVGTTTSKLILVGSGPMRPAAPEASIGPDGSFEFPRVAPGRYIVRLFPPADGPLEKSITVADRDILDFELIVPVVRTVSVQAEMDGDAPLPRVYLAFVRSRTTGTYSARAQRLSDGTFQMTFADGEYRFSSADLPPNYRVLSLTYGTVDLLKEPLIIGPDVQPMRVKFGVASPISRVRVSGHVSGAPNLGANGGRIVLNGSILGQVPSAVLDESGNFTVPDVPSGNYKIQALPGFGAPASFVSRKSTGDFETSLSEMPASNVVSVVVTDKNIEGVQLLVPVTQRVSGRAVLENKATSITQFTLALTNVSGTITSYVQPDADGKFQVVFPEGEYRVFIENLPADLKVQSVRLGAADLTKDMWRIAGRSSDELQILLTAR